MMNASQITRTITKWHVAPRDQGQTVEIAYAIDGENQTAVRRVTDRSRDVEDRRRVLYYVAPLTSMRGEWQPWNEAPDIPSRDWDEIDPIS